MMHGERRERTFLNEGCGAFWFLHGRLPREFANRLLAALCSSTDWLTSVPEPSPP
ncbi:hypothetical protein L195_g039796 [Trifolium pratense]|uniref:Uncharacterized protein n=1 Tax=Trifolium pratense TaxID=57577 RepID=A0A2K3LYX8_TRIPR|nr:hypothetical protein L195_g039796 [Trifolium pratense]